MSKDYVNNTKDQQSWTEGEIGVPESKLFEDNQVLDPTSEKLLNDIVDSILHGKITIKMIMRKLIPPKKPKKNVTTEKKTKQKEYLKKWRDEHPDYFKKYTKEKKEVNTIKYYASKLLTPAE